MSYLGRAVQKASAPSDSRASPNTPPTKSWTVRPPEARERLVRDALGAAPRIDVWMVEADGGAIGYATTLETYSSFLALPTLYLEDLFVVPEARRGGAGQAVFRHLAAEALRRGCGRLEWVVLAWNELAIGFYERLGATRMDGWHTYRLTADDLREIAPAANRC